MELIATSILQRLPRITRFYGAIDLGEGDVVIHAPGFEDRTMALVEELARPCRARAILLDYYPANEKNRLGDIREALVACGVVVQDADIVPYDRFDPSEFEALLHSRLASAPIERIVIDISTMSKLAILLSLSVCSRFDVELTVLYTEAETYGPSKLEFDEARSNDEIHRPTIQMFTGVHGVVRVDSLASVAMQGQPTAALVFMSFNDVMTQVLLNTVYPSRLFLINGRPPMHSWREAATAWIHDQVRREWERDNPVGHYEDKVAIPRRAVSTLDYTESVAELLGLYWQLSATHRILLAPAGSKMQALGCYLVKALHPDISIEYPSPEGFLPEYSSGTAARWLLKLGRISDLLEAISAEERRQFLEL